MAIRFQCPHCQGVLSISSRRIGAIVPCPTCSREILVPERDMYDAVPVIPQMAAAGRPAADAPSPLRHEPLQLAEAPKHVAVEDEPKLPDGPALMLRYTDGRRKVISLNRAAPLTFGRQSFNDVIVPDHEIAALYCRIGWNKTAFEVTAATPKGVEVNGTVVEHAVLQPKDVLRIGSLDAEFHDVPVAATPAASEPSLFEGPVLAESVTNLPVAELDESEELDDLDPAVRITRNAETDRLEAPAGIVGRVWSELDGARRRPGEQDVFRSPTILGLSIGGAVLLLIAAAIWFLIGREQRTRLFDLAETEQQDGKYQAAIEHFEEFLIKYPSDRRSRSALLATGKARVLKEMSGGAPSWDLAWQRLEELVQANRNTADYRDLQPLVRDYAEQIAIGAARAAEASKNASLLDISANATGLMERSADPDTPQAGALSLIRTATDRARIAIAKQADLDAAVEQMQSALEKGQPIVALSERAALLRKFPEFAKEGRIRDTLQKALTTEQGLIAVEDLDRAAIAEENAPPPFVTPAFHTRSRTDETSLGQVVYAIAQDSVFAVDSITGEPVWRRVIGGDSPFFPLALRGAMHGVLVYDSRNRELVLCRVETGSAIWRQPLEEAPLSSSPCIEQGQIYIATHGGRLERIDLETGRHTARIKFSQELAASPMLSPGKTHLLVAGERGLIYSIRRTPLEAAALTFTDHAPKTVRAPLMVLGRMLLLCENDQGSSARLRLWDVTKAEATLPEVPGTPPRVAGAIHEAPVLRGPQLVVSSSGERLAAFAVSDDPGRMGLAPIGQYRLQDGYGGPQYVMLGPDDQFWVSSTAFRRFKITATTIGMDTKSVAVGLTAQPLQASGETFFVARRPFFGSAVVFTNIDREQMTGSWRVAMGAQPRVLLANASGGATLVTDSALIYRLGGSRLSQGGIEYRNAIDLEVPAELKDPLLIERLTDGRVAVAMSGEKPKLWLIDSEGRVGNGPTFELAPQCPPILLDDGVVWASSGRLQLKPLSGTKRFEDWRAAADDSDQPAWTWLIRIGAHEFLAAQQDGVVRRLQARTADVPHIAEAATVQPMFAPNIKPVLLGDNLVGVAGDGALLWLNVRSFDIATGPKLPGSVRTIQSAGERLLAQLQDGGLALIAPGSEPNVLWTASLGNFALIGTPHVTNDALWLADANGEVAAVNPQTGAIQQRKRAPQSLGLGVQDIGGTLWAVANEGTLYRIENLTEVRE